MKETRNIFILTGDEQDVKTALEYIQFKGTTVLNAEDYSMENISKVFSNNKSVVCTQFSELYSSPIVINVINDAINHKNCCIYDNIVNIALDDIAGQFFRIADRFNCDIGDHISNSSGSVDAQKPSDCAYCRYLNNQSSLPKRAIYSSEHFFVITTLGEFIPGYWLIIPYEHVMSNAELDLSTQKELLTVIEDMSYLLDLTYGKSNYLVWENGTGNHGLGKARDSVIHDHTHIAPSSLTAERIETLSGFHFEKIPTEELSKYNLHSYLLIKDTDNMWRISSNPEAYIPRQYIRQLLAEEYGIPGEQWNWRKYPFKEQMIQSYYDMVDAIRKNWNNLPDRIKANTYEYV